MAPIPLHVCVKKLGLPPLLLTGVGLLMIVLGLVSWFGSESKMPVSRLVGLCIAAHVVYGAILLVARKSSFQGFAAATVLAISLLCRIILVPSPPVLSDDVYRYVWDGQTLISGTNPYAASPKAMGALTREGSVGPAINHPELRTIYPPLSQIIFGVIAFIRPTPTAFKVVMVIADTLNVLLIMLIAGNRLSFHRPTGKRRSHRGVIAGMAYGLNPLACVESGMSGHLDALGVLAVLMAIALLARGRSLWGAVLLGLGTCIKLLPALLLPAIKARRALATVLFVMVLIALYLPFLSAGKSAFASMDTYARRWEGNGSVFVLTQKAVTRVIGSFAGVSGDQEMIHIRSLDSPAAKLQGTFFSLHKDGGYDPAAPGKFVLRDLSLALTKILMGCVLVGIIGFTAYQGFAPVRAALWIFGTVILVTPILHPWYLVWVLPFAALLYNWPFFILAASSTLAYLPLDRWWTEQVWVVPAWIPLVEYGAFAAAAALYLAKRFDPRQKNESAVI